MKNLILTLVLILTTASLAIAKDITFQGCTADNKVASITLNINEAANDNAISEVRAAFSKTAQSLTAAVLITSDGFTAFVNNLTEDAYNAIDEVNGPPTIGSTCK